jgi:ectoine hydroxylase-related dioxygenase (phytanoyl-CoA dioxygenase family)
MPDPNPFRVSNDLLDDPPALRARMRDEGYLFFKGLGPVDRLAAARRDVTARLADAGWIDRDDPEAARWTGVGPYTEGEVQYMNVYREVIRLPTFLAVPEAPIFLKIASALVDGQAFCHRLRIGRITFPNNIAQATAAHQDWHYIRGTPETYTVWQPMVDCPIELGPLAILPGSHKAGFIGHSEDKTKKYASMGLTDEQIESALRRDEAAAGGGWVSGDFAVGDFVMFHSHTIHKALPNVTKDRLRLSTDNRYQKVGAEISTVSQGTHYNL